MGRLPHMKGSDHWASLHSSQADLRTNADALVPMNTRPKISWSSLEESFFKSGSIIRPRQLWMNWKDTVFNQITESPPPLPRRCLSSMYGTARTEKMINNNPLLSYIWSSVSESVRVLICQTATLETPHTIRQLHQKSLSIQKLRNCRQLKHTEIT